MTENLLGLAEDFDGWRREYDDLSFQDQKVIYARLRELWPNQRSFTVTQAYPFFDRYKPDSVVELGGWDGFLAACVLGMNRNIGSWTNYDLTTVLQCCADPRYRMVELDEPVWAVASRLRADAFVATHTIEHIKLYELRKLVSTLDVAACLIEAPLTLEPTDWTGYAGTHVLEAGWIHVDALFHDFGYLIDYSWKDGRYYAR